MDNTTFTPGWLVALLVVFTISTVAVFGLFLARHAQAAILEEEYQRNTAELKRLRPQVQALGDQLLPLIDEIKRKSDRRNAVTEAEQVAENDVTRYVEVNKGLQRDLAEAQNFSQAAYHDAIKKAADRRKEVISEENRAFMVERENDNKRLLLRQDVEGSSQAIELLKKTQRKERTEESIRVADLQSRVRQLTNQLDVTNRELRPDGHLVAGEAKDGYVVIDRGFRDNLRQGSKFTVFTRRGGAFVVKGTIQVERMDERISTCRVVEELDGNDPLIPGDLVHNPVYDPSHQRAFAVRGSFHKFSNTELERFITDAGFRLDRELSVKTDYLVVGLGADDALAQASRLGVATLTEDQLVEYVRPRTGPDRRTWDYILAEAKKGGSFGLAGRFNRANSGLITEAITSSGGRTTGGVSKGMAAVIVGDDALDIMSRARELGVPVISQDQFIDLAK